MLLFVCLCITFVRRCVACLRIQPKQIHEWDVCTIVSIFDIVYVFIVYAARYIRESNAKCGSRVQSLKDNSAEKKQRDEIDKSEGKKMKERRALIKRK